jgi:folate-binding protein YgfZ
MAITHLPGSYQRGLSALIEQDFRHIFEGAAIGSVQPRAQLAVAGKDRAAFLQGFLTNDVEALQPGTGCYAAWLTPQGRMLTDMHVLESAGMMLLDVPAGTAEATLARLEQYHFAEEVTLGALAGSLTSMWLHGPRAAGVLERVIEGGAGLDGWTAYQHQPLQFHGQPVVVARIDQLGVPGYSLFLPPSGQDSLITALAAAGAMSVGRDALEAARIEARYPIFGTDMKEDTIPLEAGIESRAISTTKGCYVGQEVIIRILHRGHGRVAKHLVGLAVEGGVPAAGAPILAADRDVGRITSAAVSPRVGTVALGYVHRDFAAPGTKLAVDGAPARVRA